MTTIQPFLRCPSLLISRKRPNRLRAAKSNTPSAPQNRDPYDDDDVKTLAKFKSRYNSIRVLEISRGLDHQFAGSRLLLLDSPGNIHSVSFFLKLLTATYFDVFATFPPILPPGPIGILGFGAGSAATLILNLFPNAIIHGWELDPAVITVGREFFGLEKLESQHSGRLFVNVGDALEGEVEGGFSGIMVDLFSKGSLIPELQDSQTWRKLKGRLRKGGRIMVNCGGSCVEAEDPLRDGKLVMEETLEAIHRIFPNEVSVLNMGLRREDNSLALTGALPDLDTWKKALPPPLQHYVNWWTPLNL